MSEPIGVMKCWECVEKHARDIEHHLEDIIRETKGKGERLGYEEWIDKIREIRKYAHHMARDISVTPLFESSSPEGEHIEMSEPKRIERGEKVWTEVFHEKEECHPSSFRVITPNPEHLGTVCCPMGQWDEEAAARGERACLVSMMLQKMEHLHPEGQGSCPVCTGA